MNLFKSMRHALALGLASTALLSAHRAEAQMPKLPLDPAIRTGQLENGLTYFIQHNEEPKGRADFYIAQKVGSILEKDSQQGLAHFLEHMAFNGTKNFPEKKLLSWLESIGVSFGSNINAYTAFDETVYTLMKVPVERQTIIDSCVLILHDWSSAITLADKEIDAERGVIQEEWRSRDNGNLRTMFSMINQALPSTQYGKRFPIGSMDVVRNFKYKELRDYYKKWYRPDLQAVIIVGDLDVNKTEETIKRIFADIPKPVNPAERTYQKVEKTNETTVAIATDPEVGKTEVYVQYRMDALPEGLRGTVIDFSLDYAFGLISQMLNERLSEIMQKPNPPFLGASFGMSPYAMVAYNLYGGMFSADIKDNNTKAGLDALVREIKRARDYGFTASEFERAKKDYMVGAKKRYTERKTRKNRNLAHACVQYFTKGGGYLIAPETEYQLTQQLEQNIKLEQVNVMVKGLLSEKNNILAYSGPKKDGVHTPTKAEFKKMFDDAFSQKVEAYKEEVSDTKLMETTPKAGKIVKEEAGHFGSKVWTLSNGAKVVIKPTKYKEDEIRLSASRLGGLFPMRGKESPATLKTLNKVMNLGGLSKFDKTALSKVLTGHIAHVYTSFGESTDNINGSCVGDDLETMLQLVYLEVTARRNDETAFKTAQETMINQLKAAQANPMHGIGDTINQLAMPNNKYVQSLSIEDVQQIDYLHSMKLANKCFDGVNGFTFVFVGNIDEAKLRPLVESYLASLPEGTKRPKVEFNKFDSVREGVHVKHYEKKLTTPMGLVFDLYSGKTEYNRRNLMVAYILNEVLDQTYTASIREKEGGTYGVHVNANVERDPFGALGLQIIFQTEPSKAEYLNGLIHKELEDIVKKGVNSEYFSKAVKSIIKRHNEKLKENGYWLSKLATFYAEDTYGEDYVTGYEELVKSIKMEEVQQFLAQILSQNNKIEVILRPISEKKEAKPATCQAVKKATCEETPQALKEEVKEEAPVEKKLTTPEQFASFPGGMQMLKAYLKARVKYPKKFYSKKIGGVMVVTFIVDKEGKTSNFVINKSTKHEELDNEVLRVVKAMPKWEPALSQGKAVTSTYSIPVIFRP